MYRFFISPEWFHGAEVAIGGELVHRLRDVLRLRAGAHITVLDDSGWEYEVELGETGGEAIRGVVVGRSQSLGEPGIEITLYQALLKGSKFELVLQKCTELGVAAFVPITSERCVVPGPRGGRLSRWRSIIREAAEQSGRGRLPVLHPVRPFAEACGSAAGPALIPWEGERVTGLKAVLGGLVAGGTRAIDLFIGPEGGFSPGEVAMARDCGIVPVSLGPRLLRAETAGLVAAAAIFYECGEMGARP